jgi:hypothetical protein
MPAATKLQHAVASKDLLGISDRRARIERGTGTVFSFRGFFRPLAR